MHRHLHQAERRHRPFRTIVRGAASFLGTAGLSFLTLWGFSSTASAQESFGDRPMFQGQPPYQGQPSIQSQPPYQGQPFSQTQPWQGQPEWSEQPPARPTEFRRQMERSWVVPHEEEYYIEFREDRPAYKEAEACDPDAVPDLVPGQLVPKSCEPILCPPHPAEMFGDFILSQGHAVAFDLGTAVTDIPLGGGRFTKIAENNSPLPQDRVYFAYNHFENALEFTLDGHAGVVGQHLATVDRYMVGFEKRFFNDLISIEARMFVFGQFENRVDTFGVEGGKFGDVPIIAKALLYRGETLMFSAGAGVTVPLGDDVLVMASGDGFRVRNDSIYLQPFFSFLHTPTPRLFHQAFLACDFDASGNTVQRVGTLTDEGELDAQELLFIDYSAGYWLKLNPPGSTLRGVAGLIELHYSHTMNDSTPFTLPAGDGTITFGNRWNRMDILNLTSGFHIAIGENTSFRAAVSVPLRDAEERVFNSEVMVQVNRRF